MSEVPKPYFRVGELGSRWVESGRRGAVGTPVRGCRNPSSEVPAWTAYTKYRQQATGYRATGLQAEGAERAEGLIHRAQATADWMDFIRIPCSWAGIAALTCSGARISCPRSIPSCIGGPRHK